MTPYIILVDIDDTLVDARWREQYMPTHDGGDVEPGAWDSYNSKSVDDREIESNVELVNLLDRNGYELWGVTSRPEKWREITEKKMSRIGVTFGLLLMRPDAEVTTPSPLLKPALVIEALKEKFDDMFTGKISDYVSFALDDRADVCEAYKALGILCLQVHLPKEKENG